MPVLPVVVPLSGVVFAGLAWDLRRRRALTLHRAAVAFAVCVYVAGVVANTISPIFLDKPAADTSWMAHLDLTPLAGYELADAVMNVAVFVPVGVVLALLLRRSSWWRVLVVVTAFSACIEISQWITAVVLAGVHVADINDLLFNVVGAGLGFLLSRAVSRVPRAAGAIEAFRWP